MKQIADELNMKGVRTTRGGRVTLNSVTTMLHNRKYIGEYRYKDIVQPGGIPAIITVELFDRVQERMAANKKAPARHKAEDEYLLTTKLFCGKCKCYMVGESGTGRSGIVHRYYKCASVKNHKGCDKKSVRKEWIETVAVELAKKIIFDDELIDKIADTVLDLLGSENTVLPLLHKQYAETQRAIDNLLRAIEQGILTASTKQRMEELEREKASLSMQITKEEMSRPSLTKEKIRFWFCRLRKLDMKKPEHRRRLIDSFLNAIILHEDYLELIFNYKEGTITVTFEELEAAGLGSDLKGLAGPLGGFYRKRPQRLPLCGLFLERRDYMSFIDLFRVNKIKAENTSLQSRITELENKLSELGFTEYTQTKAAVDQMNADIADANKTIVRLQEQIDALRAEADASEKRAASATKKLNRSKEIYKSVEYAIDNFLAYSPQYESCKITPSDESDMEELLPSVILKLHCMDMRDLRKAYNDNNKQINELLKKYESRYTTKANKAIYQLMVIALRAELQNILYNLKYEKLEKSLEDLKKMTSKYLTIAADGNQSIAGTMTKFVGEMEYLFANAVKIEYNYYVKKEQAKQEQLAIREQMRQEAEERKALEAERKKIAAEESKYEGEIAKLQEKIAASSDEERKLLESRILELQAQLSDVMVKKEQITNLQNGKAGNIYIISNLGSFGENMFKIGMTRRLNPQDRVDELGSASVPFKFDVHSFIFSDDAVSLETELHRRLNSQRVNKVNMRKEFFYSTLDDLEALVNEISPTAEFTRTMLAEEFRQSQSSDEVYTSDYVVEDIEDDE